MKKNLLLHLKTALLSSALLLMSSVPAKAGWLPFINNYGRSDYGSGMSTWRIVPYGKWTFFTNQRGLLVYDGVSWTKYQLNNRSEVRGVAVFPEMHRVYVGGENEYGYFELDSQGRMVYHCISETVDKKYGRLGNIWEIYELNNVLYLRGDNCILVIAGEKMSLIRPPYKIFASVMINGAIYVATDHGVMVIVGNQLQPITNGEKLKGKRINAMFQYGKNMIVTTATDGMYYFDGQNVTPFTTQADEQLRRGVICCAAFRDGKIAVGTIHNGLYIINTKTGSVQNFDEKKGLQNNTVLSVAFDHNGSVWAGMSYGIDHVLLEDPFSYLYRSPDSYGIGYSVSIFKGKLYLGTDRGLYVADYPVVFTNGMPEIRQVSCPSGPAWFLYQNGDELFCLHDKGIFSIQGTTATRVTDIIGAWSCSVIKGHPDRMLVGLYDGMCLLVRKDGHWTAGGSVSGISESCRYFRQTGEHQVKVYDRNIGRATVFNLSKDWRKVVSQQTIVEEYQDHDANELNALFDEWDVSGHILRLDKNCEIIPYNKGFVFLDKSKALDNRLVSIRQVHVTEPADSIVYSANFCGIKSVPAISFSHNSVRFDFQAPSMHIPTAIQYQYRLNKSEWSALSPSTTKEYSDLSEGKYTFEVRAILFNGVTSTDSFTFRILPPWYRTWYAYLLYIALMAALGWFLMKMENRRVARRQLMAVREKTQEMAQMKIEIDKLEKDKLDLDLRHKSQEIANLVISVARKNEALLDLKEQIRLVAVKLGRDNVSDSKRQLLLINNKIEANMEGDEVLKKFEEQFDLINDNFMQKLSEQHPELSNNERLMCAYLKMNLSTKEIAPLLSISVRGVETMRYRIRKKFGLGREDSLTEYLNSFQ